LLKENKKLKASIIKRRLEIARTNADNQTSMMEELSKKSSTAACRQKTRPEQRKEVLKSKPINESDGDSSDQQVLDDDIDDEDDIEDSHEDDDKNMEFVLRDFRWKSIAKKNGYLVVQFDNSTVYERADLKTMLHDFPEAVITLCGRNIHDQSKP
jgi:hypothetical protein